MSEVLDNFLRGVDSPLPASGILQMIETPHEVIKIKAKENITCGGAHWWVLRETNLLPLHITQQTFFDDYCALQIKRKSNASLEKRTSLSMFAQGDAKETQFFFFALMSKKLMIELWIDDKCYKVTPVYDLSSINTILPEAAYFSLGWQRIKEMAFSPALMHFFELHSEGWTKVTNTCQLVFKGEVDTFSKLTFLLNCFPVSNVFSIVGEPIAYTHEQGDYPLHIDASEYLNAEILCVESLKARENDTMQDIMCLPECANGLGEEETQLLWRSQRNKVRVKPFPPNAAIDAAILLPKLYCYEPNWTFSNEVVMSVTCQNETWQERWLQAESCHEYHVDTDEKCLLLQCAQAMTSNIAQLELNALKQALEILGLSSQFLQVVRHMRIDNFFSPQIKKDHLIQVPYCELVFELEEKAVFEQHFLDWYSLHYGLAAFLNWKSNFKMRVITCEDSEVLYQWSV